MLVPSRAAAQYFPTISKKKLSFKLCDQASMQIAKRLLFRWVSCHYHNMGNKCRTAGCTLNYCAFCGPSKPHPMCEGCPFFQQLEDEAAEAQTNGVLSAIAQLKPSHHIKVLDMLVNPAAVKALDFLQTQLHQRPQGLLYSII